MIPIVTLDFETYFDRDYSLKKMTTEAYIRDPRFEVQGLGLGGPMGRPSGYRETANWNLRWERYRLTARSCVTTPSSTRSSSRITTTSSPG